MATIIIDQKQYEVNLQKNLLETAIALGLDLPYFCWHPALGSVGSCRQCAVQQFADEKDTNGRLVMACMTQLKDGMRFSIEHPSCSSFRKQVIEWLMINHPHDCPVCDEGGECHLQDMTVMTGHNYRRHRFPKRTHRNQNLGPFINHEMNRCITCYRCVRYYKDLAGGDDLSAQASSGRVYFGRFQDGPLESEFSGNLVEVCPTGVFTDKVFHKRYTRKWDLETAPSVCQLCSLGCNISPGARGGVLRRIQNRYHQDINGYFICDLGRFGHEFVNADERIKQPLLRRNLVLEAVTVADARSQLKEFLNASTRTVGIGSPRASLEANWILKKWVGADNFYDGLPLSSSVVVEQTLTELSSKTVNPAKLSDIRQSDCILILGEDVTNTAPMLALSIRQGIYAFKQHKSETDLGISAWNDAAVRDFARHDRVPIFVAHVHETAIDDLATKTCIVHPQELQNIGAALLEALNNEAPSIRAMDEKLTSFINEAKLALMAAKRPVIIAGGSLFEPNLVNIASKITAVLDQINQGQTRLSLVLPEANSLGQAMLKPKPFHTLMELDGLIDVAIVLENDLHWRLGDKPFNKWLKSVKHLVVIDSLLNDTAKAASLVLPCLTFAESSGSLVSSEGRLQHFYSVFKSSLLEVESSFRMMVSCMDSEAQNQWQTLDDIDRDMALDVQGLSSAFDAFSKADFKVLGRGIPRQTSESSGRTAINANVTMHERQPPTDLDSPLTYSMEGSRNKTPLPLISSYWEPRWNSVQASFKEELAFPANSNNNFDGVRLFGKDGLEHQSSRFALERKEPNNRPGFYILPRHYIFSTAEQARFSSSLKTRIPHVHAVISEADAEQHGFLSGTRINLVTDHASFSFIVKTEDIPPGLVLLPFGLVDAAVFFQKCQLTIERGEQL